MEGLTDSVLVSLRRIIRATDLQSRRLEKQTGLTTPQLVVMRAIAAHGSNTVSAISRDVSLSQATVTNILNRLQSHGLVRRKRSKEDRRRVDVTLTAAGNRLLAKSPEPLQDEFVMRFGDLESWEQHQIVAALQRVAHMMDAENIDAAPMLAPGDQLGSTDQPASSGPSAALRVSSQGS